MDPATELAAIRKRIDAIDLEIQDLLNARARCSLEVAEVKARGASDEEEVTFYRPEREAQILREVMARNAGPLPAAHVARLFREIISSSLALEKPLSVAYLGPEGTFTEAAAIKHFGHFANVAPMTTVDEIFREVESRAAHYGVVPVENSTEGMVNRTLDCFMNTSVRICGEVELRVHQNLLAPAGVATDAITRIYSHEQSFAQCRQWLDAHLPEVERITVASNAAAARLAREESGAAAIAGSQAAERYALAVLASNIEDHPDNTTRFLVIGMQEVGPSGRDKTSILVSVRNRPGALFEVLRPLHERGISMSRIETRPSRVGNWSYVFFIDFDGHVSDERVADLLTAIRGVSMDVKVLGSYPVGVL